MRASDYEIRNYHKLDQILGRLCHMVVAGMKDPREDLYGKVAAAVLDPDNNMVYGINLPGPKGTRRHAERVAIDNYHAKYGDIPEGSIIITTCSPCSEHMSERFGDACTELIDQVGVKKVYCGYIDYTQEEEHRDFNIMETENENIRDLCKSFAETFLDNEADELTEAFDQPYSIKWEEGEDSEAVDALATLSDGTYLSIMFSKEFGDYGDDLGDWTIEFYRNNSQEVSGEGDAQKVFATVLEAIRQFVKKYKPNTVTFSASKEPEPEMVKPGANANPESRAKLYNRLVDRYAGSMGYSVQQQEGNGKVTYVLKRARKGMAENFADGRHPEDKGDSARHGIPKKASLTQLDKIGHGSGRKAQLARWQANMRRGRAK